MDDGARIEPLDPAHCDEQTRELLEALEGIAALSGGEVRRDGGLVPGQNLFRVLAHHPKLLRRWTSFGAQLLTESSLPARLREIVILRTGWLCGSEYEFGQHTLIGKAAGLADAEIAALASRNPDRGLSETEALAVRATDELVRERDLSEETWRELSASFDERAIIELVFTVGQYVLVSTVLRALRIPLEPGVPGWPEPAERGSR